MQITSLAIPEVKLVRPVKHGDARGFFSETYARRDFEAAGIIGELVQDNQSLSAATGVVRGLHFQIPPHAQAKLVRVVRGAILDVAVDIRHGSPTFGEHVTAELSAENWCQLWVPKGFAHGFCTLAPMTEVVYKVSDYYAPDCDKGMFWSDPALAIRWPVAAMAATVSAKDAILPRLIDLPCYFRYP